jgi:hypothetical protein
MQHGFDHLFTLFFLLVWYSIGLDIWRFAGIFEGDLLITTLLGGSVVTSAMIA